MQLKKEGKDLVPVSLNISRLDFELCDIVQYLDECSEKYNIPRDYLDVEITESALTESRDILLDVIAKLKSRGYSIWLDDFGSGYSSLNVLKDYEFDVMKIDMHFLKGFGNNEKTYKILETVVKLSGLLGMKSLTEGIETNEQMNFMRSIGCNKLQGFLFGKPAPFDKIIELIKSGELKISSEYLKQ